MFSSVTVPTRIPPKNGRAYDAEHHATDKANDSRTGIMGHQSPSPKHPQTNVRSVRSEKDGNGAHTPKDHVAAMWKIQLLNGVTPTQLKTSLKKGLPTCVQSVKMIVTDFNSARLSNSVTAWQCEGNMQHRTASASIAVVLSLIIVQLPALSHQAVRTVLVIT